MQENNSKAKPVSVVSVEDKMRQLVNAQTSEVKEVILGLSNRERVGAFTELLLIGTTNEKWAQQDFIKNQIYRQVAPAIHKRDWDFLIDAFRKCDVVYAQNGKPALFQWVNVRWKDECARKQCVQAEKMKAPALTADQFAKLEELVHAQ